ncbi:MAG: N-acetylmuramoyl-L-alanine amidase [Spirochaetes bacterium]|nr:N-acetylmuramoyl-L-alanine amidase [Spirochaetota bacterium]
MNKAEKAISVIIFLCFVLSAAGAGGAQPLLEFARIQKLGLNWDPLTGTGYLEKEGSYVSFATDRPFLVYDWKQIAKVSPPYLEANNLVLPEDFQSKVRSLLEDHSHTGNARYSVAAILIDPGHGGKDTGAIGEIGGMRLLEKDLALEVSKRVIDLLRSRFPNRKILVTRKGDSYPTLDDRVAMANSVDLEKDEAVIYVSIHANASFNKTAKGYEVWYLNPEYRRTVVDAETVKEKGKDIAPILNAMLEEEFTTESIILARKVYERLGVELGRQSPGRGIRPEEWFVVRNAKMPSILIEMGFITNPDEGRSLSGSGYLRRIGDAIYNGIVDFIDYFER